ncbi:type II toxin-antitoxin system VapC family toxin [Subtercola frigoramans]|uniref:Nucleic acid-binding protein n=1 Tax=Subtercola frigoramans TaxID=120298 RepID=A0ABS2L1F2_9MICO|nr:type II toxin-antitoxin system VapC family toxin [Subtercola frigoramans]MBM7470892.1 putative nucleic acid-binding protein [Subtercola frigoramans]
MIVYLDTSAVGKLLIDEAESLALAQHLDELAAVPGTVIASGFILETELRRLANRVSIAQAAVTELLSRFTLIDMGRSIYREAGLIPEPSLRSLDALHIAAAQHIAADVFITYDHRQRFAAQILGLTIEQPGVTVN